MVAQGADGDGSGSLDGLEVEGALRSAGYALHSRARAALVARFADRRLRIALPAFLALAARLHALIGAVSRPSFGDGEED